MTSFTPLLDLADLKLEANDVDFSEFERRPAELEMSICFERATSVDSAAHLDRSSSLQSSINWEVTATSDAEQSFWRQDSMDSVLAGFEHITDMSADVGDQQCSSSSDAQLDELVQPQEATSLEHRGRSATARATSLKPDILQELAELDQALALTTPRSSATSAPRSKTPRSVMTPRSASARTPRREGTALYAASPRSAFARNAATKPSKKKPIVASKYCHVCARTGPRIRYVTCAALAQDGSCRKVVCERCCDVHGWNFTDILANADWRCPHCEGQCPPKARCHVYHVVNAKRPSKSGMTALSSGAPLPRSQNASPSTTAGLDELDYAAPLVNFDDNFGLDLSLLK
mmetsp:Transcript_15478/g.41562  ORF Transcript_15478/g.41562 Transcript_15478/m.41562 type:complete len:347 (+) Transcript_15478:153-1193(+)